MNIDKDIVLEHGRWCLTQVANPSFLTRPTGAWERITAIMDQRRMDITSGRVVLCVGTSL